MSTAAFTSSRSIRAMFSPYGKKLRETRLTGHIRRSTNLYTCLNLRFRRKSQKGRKNQHHSGFSDIKVLPHGHPRQAFHHAKKALPCGTVMPCFERVRTQNPSMYRNARSSCYERSGTRGAPSGSPVPKNLRDIYLYPEECKTATFTTYYRRR